MKTLLVLCDFYTMHPNSTHLPLPLYLPSKLATSLQQRKKIVLWGVAVCPAVHPLSTLLRLQMFVAVAHGSGTRPLASAMLSKLEPHGLILDILLLLCVL